MSPDVQYETRTTQDVAGTKTAMGWIKKISGRMWGPGHELLDGGAVIRARTDRNVLWARVRDGKVHAVRIRLDPQTDIYWCTCPSYERVCQHVVAALLYASRNLPEMIRYEWEEGPMIDHFLEGITDGEVRDLLIKKIDDTMVNYYDSEEEKTLSPVVQKIKDDMRKVDELTGQEARSLLVRKITYDYGAYMGIVRMVGRKEIWSRADCRYSIEKMFAGMEHEMCDGRIRSSPHLDFNKFFQRARRYFRQERYHHAASIYQGIVEAINDNADQVNDSDEYYAKRFEKAIGEMAEVVNLADQTHPRKRQYISYLHEMFVRNYPEYFNWFYGEALRTVCTTKDDLKFWRGLHQPLIPDHLPDKDNFSKHYRAIDMISMQEHILRNLRDPSLEDFYKKYHMSARRICQAYVRWLADRDPDRARQIDEEGKKRFPEEEIVITDMTW